MNHQTQYAHPALLIPFDELYAGLEACVAAGDVDRRTPSDGDDDSGLVLYNYNETCQFERRWNKYNWLARGLVLRPSEKEIVALCMPKFFNVTEPEAPSIHNGDEYEATTKLDGSCGIGFHDRGEWHVATRGSFSSDQAVWATNYLRAHAGFMAYLDPDVTYITEIIYPENRVVIKYDFADLVLLTGYNRKTGHELDYVSELVPLSHRIGCRVADRHFFSSLQELLAVAKALPGTQEGFVLRLKGSGDRAKVKGDQYKIIHKMISQVTPLGIYELMLEGKPIEESKRLIPEEFYDDFDTIVRLLGEKVDRIIDGTNELVQSVAYMSDKEVGLAMSTFGEFGQYVFTARKKGQDALRLIALKAVRPTGNRLDGYHTSIAMNRVFTSSSEG